jgi:PadR family transcriptional regulator PadR
MRRKPGNLVPFELSILVVVLRLHEAGAESSYGYRIAKDLATVSDRKLSAYGTLYRALGRLEKMGLLRSRWEDPRLAADAARPGRRLYTLTDAGAAAARNAQKAAPAAARIRRRQLARA